MSIKASISGQEVQCLMESLRDNFNKIVQKALRMESSKIKDEPTVAGYMTILQSQPMYDSNNVVDYSEEINQEAEKKTRFLSTAEY